MSAAQPAAASAGPLSEYERRRAAGVILPDPAQRRAMERLQQLYEELLTYRHESGGRRWLARIGLGERSAAEPPRGLYLYGPVGRGKSQLMDMFFAAVPMRRKRRVHFHAFMLEVHNRIEHERRAGADSPILKTAADIATAARLLCFDEFQVNDIADAMILERLFRALLDAGVVVVATSNRAPAQLYEHGLQRDRFLPFIAFIEERLDVLAVEGERDYRLARLLGKPVYYTPLDERAHRALADAFASLAAGAPAGEETLTVLGRTLSVPRAAGDVAWFGFDELCARPLAAPDYLALAERFPALIVEGIPRLPPQRRNEAQRFHILIDTLYEARTLLVASAEVPPQQIYTKGDGSFEFQRTVSRLMEMQSEGWRADRKRP
ncbi:MAG TPA: cell division protein ZapE [Stellaceae bacterium]|nr:cell division protein ZapE [Stellaceae bacterium]